MMANFEKINADYKRTFGEAAPYAYKTGMPKPISMGLAQQPPSRELTKAFNDWKVSLKSKMYMRIEGNFVKFYIESAEDASAGAKQYALIPVTDGKGDHISIKLQDLDMAVEKKTPVKVKAAPSGLTRQTASVGETKKSYTTIRGAGRDMPNN
jgi:hypothetical protein